MESHWLVSIDMSANEGSLSLFRLGDTPGPRLEEEIILGGAMRHSEALFDSLHQLLAPLSLAPADIGEWWVNQGPGSFTGLRISLAAVKGICSVTGARLVLCDGSEARARSWLASHPNRGIEIREIEIKVCTRSTASKYIVQPYLWDGSKLVERPAAFTECIPIASNRSVVLSDAPLKNEGENTRAVHWPSLSSYLPFSPPSRILEGEAAIALASPTYFASREFAKAASI